MAVASISVGVNEMRYCTRHQGYSPRKGGVVIKSPDGLRERWICECCHRTSITKMCKALGLSDEFVEEMIEETS